MSWIKLLVKGVNGLPGDTVSFSGGYAINGQRLEEEYLDQQGGTTIEAPTSPPSPCRRSACSFWAITARLNDARYWEEASILQ